jgi:tetratricopeptide (TPR) repeat protein
VGQPLCPRELLQVCLPNWCRGVRWARELPKLATEWAASPEEGALLDHAQKAEKWLDEGRWANARRELDKIIELDPKNASAYLNRGVALGELGEAVKAITDLTRAAELYSQETEPDLPNYVLCHYNRGNQRAKIGEWLHAVADYSRAIELNPQHVKSYVNRGIGQAELGKIEQAKSDLRQARARTNDPGLQSSIDATMSEIDGGQVLS